MFFTFVMILVTIYSVFRISLDLHQIKYIKSTHISDNELNLVKLNQEYVSKSKLYNIEKLYLSIFSIVIKSSIVIIFVAFNGMFIFKDISNIINVFTINAEVFNIILFIIILTLIDLPFSYYKVFFIENNYGFNRQSKLLFFKDFVLSLLISLIIISTLFTIFNKLYNFYIDDWWLYMWLIFIIFNILVMYLFPIIISPLFNNFKKIDDEEIISEIKDLSKKTNFKISNIYIMDGSKRSGHSNAYFTGFYKNKRIVFYDTLIDLLTPTEIRSVLAHEIGHYVKKHIMLSMIINFFMSFIFFYIIYKMTSIEMLFTELGVDQTSSSQIVILFSLLLPCVLYFITPLFSVLSRKNEYEADNYAKLHSDKNDLISSLLKLYKENLSLIKSSPIYSSIYSSHPTVFERINNLKL